MNLEDYQWLVSSDAEAWLELASSSDPSSLVALTKKLRKALSPERTSLVLEQVELRQRAKVKFAGANQMFFTRKLLEQATDDVIAAYKARRFPMDSPIADLCCGIGGDTMGLAARGPVAGIDLNRVATQLAKANCQSRGLEQACFETTAAEKVDLKTFAAWHLDPDRRASGKRSTRLELHEPSEAAIDSILRANRNAAIKLAPATQVPDGWTSEAELEWIGSRGECRQQVVWCGNLASHPGERSATMLNSNGQVASSVRGRPDFDIPTTERVASFLFEPTPVVLAAGLAGVLAGEHNLSKLSHETGYLTGDKAVDDPALVCLQVQDVLPFDIKKLKSFLSSRKIGRLEIKKRGVDVKPEHLAKQLKPVGSESAVLVLTPIGGAVKAILTRRVTAASATNHN